MGSDPKKPIIEEEEDEGSTAMFSREAHGWFSSMADGREADAESVADLARNAVVDTSPLSRTGAAPASRTGANPVVNLGRTGGLAASRVPTPVPPPAAAAPSTRSVPAGKAPAAPSRMAALANLSPKQVVVVAFVGGAVLAGIVGVAAFLILTAR